MMIRIPGVLLRNALLVATTVCAMLSLAGHAANVAVDCADCHATPPVSAAHPKLTSVSLPGCLECHEVQPGDRFMRAVHDKHLAVGFDCAMCHGADAPPRAELDALLKDAAK